jgi:hypothetical protein
VLISRTDPSKKYDVVFDFSAKRALKKQRVTGAVAAGKTHVSLTVESADETAIPDGDYDLHPEGDKTVYGVNKSGNSWTLI